ncbi:hypothetical protein SAMN06297164_3444 [Nitrosomonas ureae]|uniref:Uncharacterized protein n=1 Tax=Nitrosomonas ureae TaxID=44577 RepID=A0A286AKD5_9PROT|nr:hypothetical protein SAMN06297164_3444 [Nitrosomonas ureae]
MSVYGNYVMKLAIILILIEGNITLKNVFYADF